MAPHDDKPSGGHAPRQNNMEGPTAEESIEQSADSVLDETLLSCPDLHTTMGNFTEQNGEQYEQEYGGKDLLNMRPSVTDAKDDDTIIDCARNRYTKDEVLNIIRAYKKDSRNFFWGDLQNACNRRNRKFDDRWYNWTREMMEGIDRNDFCMRSILMNYSHSTIQSVCKEVGGDFWNLKTSAKLEAYMKDIYKIRKRIKSNKGLTTCWGRIKYEGVFKSRMRKIRRSTSKAPENAIDNYLELKSAALNKYYSSVAEKDELSRLYNKN